MNSCSKFCAKRTEEGEDRIPQDRDLQHAHAAEAVGERAGKPAAERRGHDGDGADRAGGAGRHAPYRNDRGDDVAVQLLIEAVQGPAAPAGQHRPAFPRGQIAQPGQHRVSFPFGFIGGLILAGQACRRIPNAPPKAAFRFPSPP